MFIIILGHQQVIQVYGILSNINSEVDWYHNHRTTRFHPLILSLAAKISSLSLLIMAPLQTLQSASPPFSDRHSQSCLLILSLCFLDLIIASALQLLQYFSVSNYFTALSCCSIAWNTEVISRFSSLFCWCSNGVVFWDSDSLKLRARFSDQYFWRSENSVYQRYCESCCSFLRRFSLVSRWADISACSQMLLPSMRLLRRVVTLLTFSMSLLHLRMVWWVRVLTSSTSLSYLAMQSLYILASSSWRALISSLSLRTLTSTSALLCWYSSSRSSWTLTSLARVPSRLWTLRSFWSFSPVSHLTRSTACLKVLIWLISWLLWVCRCSSFRFTSRPMQSCSCCIFSRCSSTSDSQLRDSFWYLARSSSTVLCGDSWCSCASASLVRVRKFSVENDSLIESVFSYNVPIRQMLFDRRIGFFRIFVSLDCRNSCLKDSISRTFLSTWMRLFSSLCRSRESSCFSLSGPRQASSRKVRLDSVFSKSVFSLSDWRRLISSMKWLSGLSGSLRISFMNRQKLPMLLMAVTVKPGMSQFPFVSSSITTFEQLGFCEPILFSESYNLKNLRPRSMMRSLASSRQETDTMKCLMWSQDLALLKMYSMARSMMPRSVLRAMLPGSLSISAMFSPSCPLKKSDVRFSSSSFPIRVYVLPLFGAPYAIIVELKPSISFSTDFLASSSYVFTWFQVQLKLVLCKMYIQLKLQVVNSLPFRNCSVLGSVMSTFLKPDSQDFIRTYCLNSASVIMELYNLYTPLILYPDTHTETIFTIVQRKYRVQERKPSQFLRQIIHKFIKIFPILRLLLHQKLKICVRREFGASDINFQMSKTPEQMSPSEHSPNSSINESDVRLQEQAASDRSSRGSSFTLADSSMESKNDLNINKVLNKLGLVESKHPKQEFDQAINTVVSNFIEIDTSALHAEYDEQFKSMYNSAQNSYEPKCSHYIFVSEYEDIEYLEVMDDGSVLKSSYKSLRLLLKKVSLLSLSIVSHNAFEFTVLIVIILNSIKMALDDPLAQTSTPLQQQLQSIFLILYCIEMCFKIMAFGFVFNQGAYLRDPWNILDFVIVVTSLMPLFMTVNFSVNSLRAVRVLRPLKTITKVKVLKMIVRTLFLSFSLVLDSLYILVFVIIVFAIAGTQLFGGDLKNRCIYLPTGNVTEVYCQATSSPNSCTPLGGDYACGRGISSPNFSIINFDTVLWSMLTIFQILTMEGWSVVMIALEQCYSVVCALYCVAIVFLCEYVLLNMTLAILKYKYAQVKDNSIEEEEEEKYEYTPELMKKIGAYREFAQIKESDYERIKGDDGRAFVGASRFFKDEVKQIEKRLTLPKPTIRKYSKINNGLLKKQRQKMIVENSKNQKIEVKWDPKSLHFEPIIFEHVQIDEKAIKSRRYLKEQLEKTTKNLEDGISQEQYSEQQQQEEEQAAAGETTIKEVSHESGKQLVTQKIITFLKEETPATKIKDLFQFNEMLDDLQKNYSRKNIKPNDEKQHKSYFELPDLVLDQTKREKFYNHFSNLGRYGVQRIAKPQAAAHIPVKPIKRQPTLNLNKRSSMNKIAEQIQLDIKELQLLNDLSKKKMKCRLKAIQLLDTSNSYKIDEVLVSRQKRKEEEQQREIQEKASLVCSKIVYKVRDDQGEETTIANLSEKPKAEKKGEGIKRKKKDQKDMNGYLSIPEIARNKVDFIKQVNKISNANNIQKTEELSAISDDKVYKNKLRMRGVMKSNWRIEDEPTEMELIRQYFNTSEIEARGGGKKLQKMKSLHSLKDSEEKEDPKMPNNQAKKTAETNEAEFYSIKNSDVAHKTNRIEVTCSAEDLKAMNKAQYASISSLNPLDEEYQIYIKGLSGIFKVFRNKVCIVISSSYYDNAVLILVLANTVILSLNGFVDAESPVLLMLNQIFTYSFAVDVSLKLIAYGTTFFEDAMNLFDLFVVVVSIIEASLEGLTLNLSALRSIRIFRAFRVLRVTRLVRSLSFMKIVMAVVVSVISEFVYIFMLLTLFIFIYTLLGMQIFGGNFLPQPLTSVRQNFDTFFNALFTVFQVLTVENWNDIETAILASSSGIVTILFLISWIFIGNWILMNLLQAILLDGFDEDTNDEAKMAVEEEKQIDEELGVGNTATSVTRFKEYTQLNMETQPSQLTDEKEQGEAIVLEEDYSLFIFARSGPVRTNLLKLLKHKYFEYVMMVCIAFSSFKLVFDTYIEDPNSDLAVLSGTIDKVFNGIFILEAALNIVCYGLVIGPTSYLSDNWSKLDFFIVITAIIDMTVTNVDLSIIKMLRSLRPLRILTRNLNMRIIITALGYSMAGIANVLIIILLVFMMFGILAINLLQGKLDYCNLSTNGQLTYGNYGPYGISQVQCSQLGGTWTTQFINFDNILNSLLSLYVFSTRENWPYYVYTFIDAETDGPVLDNNSILFFIFSVVFIFVCSYFFMDLLVGVLFLNFHQAEAKLRPKILLDCQINWINLQKLIVTVDPCLTLYLKPENRFKQMFFRLVSHKYFEWFTLFCITSNILVMCINMDDETDATVSLLKTINTVFSGIFLLEMILKLVAYGKGYFLLGWNVFDCAVVMASVLDFALDRIGVGLTNSALSVLPQIARISRVLRVTRILRMFKRFRGLQKLIETFIFMMPALANGLALISLFLFISSVVSSYLLQDIGPDYSGFYSGTLNFMNFHSSLHLLFICTTGENWYVYMFESMYPGYTQCLAEGCTSPYNICFWLVYIFFSQKVFMEMFVLIVLDQFESNYINENNPLGVFALLEDDFRAVWIEKTQKHKGLKLESKKLVDLILHLKPPLGIGVGELQQKYEEELKENHQLSEEEIKSKSYEFYMKLKHTSAKWSLKMETLLNKNYITYHETFWNVAKCAYLNDFMDRTTPAQMEMLDAINKEWEGQLKAMQKEIKSDKNEDQSVAAAMNPMQTILFSQMIINSWNKYASKKNKNPDENQKEKFDENDDSYIKSCGSDQDEAKFEVAEQFKKRRQGMMMMERGNLATFIPDTEAYEDQNFTSRRWSRRSARLSKRGEDLFALRERPSIAMKL